MGADMDGEELVNTWRQLATFCKASSEPICSSSASRSTFSAQCTAVHETWRAVENVLRCTALNFMARSQSQCNERSVYVLSGNADATRALHMKASKKHTLTLGGVDCRLIRYDVLPKMPVNVQRFESRRITSKRVVQDASLTK